MTPVWLLFTSGTTAAPKGAMLTHASVLAAVAASTAARPVEARRRLPLPVPALPRRRLQRRAPPRRTAVPSCWSTASRPGRSARPVAAEGVTSTSRGRHDARRRCSTTSTPSRRPATSSHTLRSVAYGAAPMAAVADAAGGRHPRGGADPGLRHDRALGQRRVPRPRDPPAGPGGRRAPPARRRPSRPRRRGQGRRCRRPHPPDRRGRRDPRPGAPGHGRLPRRPRRHRRRPPRRLAAHRRRRPVRRRGPALRRRPEQGHHHHRRRERLVARGRGRAAHRTRRVPGRGGRGARPHLGRERLRRGGAHRRRLVRPRRCWWPRPGPGWPGSRCPGTWSSPTPCR